MRMVYTSVLWMYACNVVGWVTGRYVACGSIVPMI